MMHRNRHAVIALMLSLSMATPRMGLAQTSEPKLAPVPIDRNQPAPFDGILMPQPTALKLALEVDGCLDRQHITERQAAETLSLQVAETEAAQKDAQTQRGLALKCDQMLRQSEAEVTEARSQLSHGYGVLCFSVGLIVGTAVGLGLAALRQDAQHG